MENYLVLTYVAYASVAIPLVVWLARTLTANGATFLADVFDGQPDLATAVNRLLAIGFLLLNLGYALMLLTSNEGATTLLAAVELLINKLGILLLSLGVLHFANMFVFWRVRSRADTQGRLPVAPTVVHAPPPAPTNA